MKTKPVIVVVAYRRLHTLKRLLHSLTKAFYQTENITLIISIDYHSDNAEVVECANSFQWEHGNKIVKTHNENLGLRRHIIECGDYAAQYGSAIILEDDEIVAPSFYEYTRRAHDFYGEDDRIAGISLYSHEWNGYAGKKFQPVYQAGDVYFGQFSCTRGESWSAEQWKGFKEWYEKNPDIKQDELLPPSIYQWNKSWGKFFARYLVETNKYYVMPYKPVATVFGEVGTHSSLAELDVQVSLYWGRDNCSFIPFEEGQHYDIFFENVDLKEILAERYNIKAEDICVDLYALKNRKYSDKRYLLSTRKLNCEIIAQYDLNLRPHDMNVMLEMPGIGIYLYDRSKAAKNRSYRSKDRLAYDFAGIHSLEALRYSWHHGWNVLFQCMGIIK